MKDISHIAIPSLFKLSQRNIFPQNLNFWYFNHCYALKAVTIEFKSHQRWVKARLFQERRFEVMVDSLVKMLTLCLAVVEKANSMVGVISREIENANIRMPYKVWPFLERTVQESAPSLEKETTFGAKVDMIEIYKILHYGGENYYPSLIVSVNKRFI